MGKKVIMSILTLLLLVQLVSAATPNPGHDASSVGPGTFALGDYIFPGNVDVENLTASGTGAFVTIDTGQGANELYDMDQNVLETSEVIFNTVHAHSSASEVILLVNQTSSGNVDLMRIVGGAGMGLLIDVGGSTGASIQMNTPATMTGLTTNAKIQSAFLNVNSTDDFSFSVNSGADATGSVHVVRDTGSLETAGPVVLIHQDQAGDDQDVLKIQNDGTGALATFTESATFYFDINTASDGSGSVHILRNHGSLDTAGPVMLIHQDSAGDDQNVLNIQNNGTGTALSVVGGTGRSVYISSGGDYPSIEIDSVTTTTPALKINDVVSNKAIAINTGDKFCADNETTCNFGLYFNGTHFISGFIG